MSGRLGSLVVFAVMSAALLLFAVLTFGRVSGVEMAPHTFQQRSYDFYQVPWLGWQITPVIQAPQNPSLVVYLKNQSLVANQLPANQRARWDVIQVREGGRERAGDANILSDYLQAGETKWLSWSEAHPELARSHWEAVQDAACMGAYVLIPEIFRAAEHAADPAEFAARVRATLLCDGERLGDEFLAAGQPQRAAELFLHLASMDPDNEALQTKLAGLSGYVMRPKPPVDQSLPPQSADAELTHEGAATDLP